MRALWQLVCKHAQVLWDDLRYVLALSRARTLSGAAQALNVTHTTVGRRLDELERSTGLRVFDRTPDGYVATMAGQELVDVAERVEAEVLAAEGRVLGHDQALAGALRVSTMDMLFRCHHHVFSSFLERYPSVALTVTTTDDEVSLPRRQADAVLRMTNTPPGYLVGRKVGRVEFAVYASRSLVTRIGRGAPLAAYPWLNWDERLNQPWLDQWLATNVPGARTAIRLDTSSLGLHAAVTAGLGVHFLACVDGDADPALERIGPIESIFTRDLWVLTLRELRSTPRVRAFMDHVEESLRQKPKALGGRRSKVRKPP
jgi:DNA-binding transcriptional LysR family regulator